MPVSEARLQGFQQSKPRQLHVLVGYNQMPFAGLSFAEPE
jgi:hypothetical protein